MSGPVVDAGLFAAVEDVVRSLTADRVDTCRTRSHRYGIKAWFGGETPGREHYEAQILGRHKVDGVKGVALEIGFHAEHKLESDNVAVLDRLVAAEATWRAVLGDEAVAGVFFDASKWRRLSDVWLDPDLGGDDAAFDIGSRLIDYIDVVEPLRAGESSD